jgi:hypothetical protein
MDSGKIVDCSESGILATGMATLLAAFFNGKEFFRGNVYRNKMAKQKWREN